MYIKIINYIHKHNYYILLLDMCVSPNWVLKTSDFPLNMSNRLGPLVDFCKPNLKHLGWPLTSTLAKQMWLAIHPMTSHSNPYGGHIMTYLSSKAGASSACPSKLRSPPHPNKWLDCARAWSWRSGLRGDLQETSGKHVSSSHDFHEFWDFPKDCPFSGMVWWDLLWISTSPRGMGQWDIILQHLVPLQTAPEASTCSVSLAAKGHPPAGRFVTGDGRIHAFPQGILHHPKSGST